MRSARQIVWRGVILFLFGLIFTILLSLLQSRRNNLSFHARLNTVRIDPNWWIPLVCGTGSAIIGLIYPCLECRNVNEAIKNKEWSHVLRCVAMFVGINEACTKVDFPSNFQLTLSLAILSIGLWWYSNRTTVGFGLGILVAVLATLVSQMLVYHRVYVYSEKEFSFVRSWLPCVVFSGGVTVANIGKQLAVDDFKDYERKSHAE